MAVSTIAAIKTKLNAKYAQASQVQTTADEMIDILDTLMGAPTVSSMNIPVYSAGVPANAAVMFAFSAPGSLALPADLAGSAFNLDTAATAETVLTIKVDGTSKGTITFAISGTTGTIVFASAVTLAAGEILTIENQADNDDTAADLNGLLAGVYTA